MVRGLTAVLVVFVVVAAGMGHATSIERLMSLGRHLAQECTACHRPEGEHNGIPSLVGLDPEYFVNSLDFYRSGKRTNPTMVSVAQSLDDEQIKALSLYFASLPKPNSFEASNASTSGGASQAR